MTDKCVHEPLWHATILEPEIERQMTYHLLALSICGVFTCIAVSISVWLILQHALHYLRPYEQKHIIRIIALVPIFAVTSFLGYVFYRQAIYFDILWSCYEAYVIASFFALMCHYLDPTLHGQKEYLRTIQPKNWRAPLNWLQKLTGGEDKGCFRRPQSGLTWFNIMYFGIFQYCLIRTVFMIVAMGAESVKTYCRDDPQPRFASLWITIFQAISVLTAIFCLVQFYEQFKEELAPQHVLLKLVSVKLGIFVVFWQHLLIAILTRGDVGVIRPNGNKYISGPDLRLGIPCVLTCFEMAVFAGLCCRTFPWAPYDLERRLLLVPEQGYADGPVDALLQAVNPWDYAKAAARGFRWLCYGVHIRKEDVSYQHEDIQDTPSNPQTGPQDIKLTVVNRRTKNRTYPVDGLLRRRQRADGVQTD